MDFLKGCAGWVAMLFIVAAGPDIWTQTKATFVGARAPVVKTAIQKLPEVKKTSAPKVSDGYSGPRTCADVAAMPAVTISTTKKKTNSTKSPKPQSAATVFLSPGQIAPDAVIAGLPKAPHRPILSQLFPNRFK